MKKQLVFKILALLLPIVLLVILEITLRVIGYGNNYNLFNRIEIENKPDYLILNKKVASKYFKDNELRSDNQSDLFLKSKTENTFRVFVQGASTVVGFPYYRGGSFPRMLKHRLSLTFPDKNIEVINTGLTAVNSYTLWDMTDDIIAQKPDLVIIYAGHNEYYGALGVGSSISYGSHPSLIRAYLRLKNLRFFQLLENGYSKIVSTTSEKPSERETTLMEVLAKEQRIPFQSEVYYNGLEQFESNLEKIISKYKRNDVPVIISSVVSNIEDIKPFISDEIPNEVEFQRELTLNRAKAAKLAQNNALAAYKLAESYQTINKDSSSKYYHLAKELDMLRFRAPEEINSIIKRISKDHQISMIDMEEVFKENSADGIIGNDLMTEHVHPNIHGQFLMADAFYREIKELGLLKDWSKEVNFDEAFSDIPITKIDSLQGMMVIDELKKSWPYDMSMSGRRPETSSFPGSTFEEVMAHNIHNKIAKWDEVMAFAYQTYHNDKTYEKALTVAESLIFKYPEQGKVYEMAGTTSMKLGNFKRAIFYYSKLNKIEPSALSANQLALAYIKLDDNTAAEKVLQEAKTNGYKVKELEEIKDEALSTNQDMN